MNTITETQHLYLREFDAADAVNLFELNADPEVIRFTGDVAFPDIESARKFLQTYTHYRVYGFGRWAVIRKSDSAFLGWAGIKYTPIRDEHDIGFRFFRKYWNHGYASEAARACVAYAFAQLGLMRIVGRAMEDNTASLRVLDKLEMKYFNSFEQEGKKWCVYLLEKEK